MDFDSIISFLLILLFFIAPTLLKRFNQKKKTDGSPQAGMIKTGEEKKLSLFEKLGDQLREYAQTLEQDAQKGTPDNIWEHLDEEQDLPPSHEDSFEGEFDTPGYGIEPMADTPVIAKASVMPEKKEREPAPKPERKGSCCDSPGAGSFRSPKLSSCQLQQAIVWSEILSKPVALRHS